MDKVITVIVFLFVGLTCSFSGVHAQVTLSIHPRQVNEYSSQTLICTYSGTVTGLIWRKSSLEIVGAFSLQANTCNSHKEPDRALYSYNCSVGTNTFALTVLSVTRANKGDTYHCLIYINDNAVASNSVSLDLIVPITSVTMTQPVTDVVTAQVNTTAVFVCETSGGLPAAQVTWFKDSETPDNSIDDIVITPSSTFSTSNTSDNLIKVTSRLNYSPLQLDRNMRIYCKANNGGSTTYISYIKPLLDVQYPPESSPFIQQGTTFKVIEQTQATLSCSVTGGNPLSNLTWKCYTGVISNRTAGETVTKEVSWIASRGQDGSCTCVSTYYNLVQNVSIRIEILYSSSIVSFTLNGVQESSTVSENDTVLPVICDVDSNPGSVITIQHDGTTLLTQNDAKQLKYSIAQAQCTDAGYYHCIAQNAYNIQPAVRVIRLLVKCSPRPSPYVPLIDRVRTGLHKSTTLEFSSLSYPEPTAFKWFKVTDSALMPIENTDNTLITSKAVNTSLTIVNVTENFLGKYLLTVLNEQGVWNQSYFVEAYTSPFPPTNFKASIIHDALVFYWESSFNGGLEQSFLIQTSQEGTDLWSNQTLIHESDEPYRINKGQYVDVVTDLPSGVYLCRLIAVNFLGNAKAVYLKTPLEMSRRDLSIDMKVNAVGDNSAVITGIVLGIVVIGLVVCVVLLILKLRRTSNIKGESISVNTTSRMNLPVYDNVQYNYEPTEHEERLSRNMRGPRPIHGDVALQGVGEYASLDQRLKDDSAAYDVINSRQNT